MSHKQAKRLRKSGGGHVRREQRVTVTEQAREQRASRGKGAEVDIGMLVALGAGMRFRR